MKKEDIITLPNPKLRRRSVKVQTITPEIKQLINDMVDVSLDWEDSRPHEISAALAAAQIGRPERVIIVRSDLEDKSVRKFTALINPEIIKLEGEVVEDFEGCLSVPDSIYGKIPRHSRVRVKALDIDGNKVRIKAEDFLARILQHEIDHINGIVFIDHIRDNKDAFFKLNSKGELQPLDYDKDIKNNDKLWS